MLIGYARVSKHDGTQVLDLQLDALQAAGVAPGKIYTDHMSGATVDRPGLEACLRALRTDDTLIVWKLDRLGRSLKHLIETVEDLTELGVGFKVLTGQGASIDTTTPNGKLVFTIFAALAEYERELLRERTMAGLQAARARGRVGGRPFALTGANLAGAIAPTEQTVEEVANDLRVSPSTIYRARRRARAAQAAD
jgi:DNA invertase Pin-like site-specific DNA recombinase